MNNSSEKTNIIAWLSKFRINNYNLVFDEINQEYVINVDGNVPLHAYKLDILPFKFGKVTGDFDVAINCLDCLNNCPDYVGGSFSATDNNLTDLKYLPKFIGKHIYLYNNNISNLEGLPTKVNGDLYLQNNKLTSFEHISREILGKLIIHSNNIQNFDFFPEYVANKINLNYNIKLKPLSCIENFSQLQKELNYIDLTNNLPTNHYQTKKRKI